MPKVKPELRGSRTPRVEVTMLEPLFVLSAVYAHQCRGDKTKFRASVRHTVETCQNLSLPVCLAVCIAHELNGCTTSEACTLDRFECQWRDAQVPSDLSQEMAEAPAGEHQALVPNTINAHIRGPARDATYVGH